MLSGPGMRSRAAERKPRISEPLGGRPPQKQPGLEKGPGWGAGSEKPGRDGDRLSERVIATSHSRREAIATSTFLLRVE